MLQLVVILGTARMLSVVLFPIVSRLVTAVALYPDVAPDGVTFPTFALFMASVMSITAFPIMARVLEKRDITHTLIGRLSLTSAAFVGTGLSDPS